MHKNIYFEDIKHDQSYKYLKLFSTHPSILWVKWNKWVEFDDFDSYFNSLLKSDTFLRNKSSRCSYYAIVFESITFSLSNLNVIVELLLEKNEEITTLTNDLMNMSLNFESIEIEHGLNGVYIFCQHSYHIWITPKVP